MNSKISSIVGSTAASRGSNLPVLQMYLKLLLRYRWIIAGAAAAAMLLALIVTLMLDKQYSASVELEIAREDANIVNIQGVQPEGGSLDQEFYQTQYGLLESRSLIERVIDDLDLVDDVDFLERHDAIEGELFATNARLPNDRESRRERERKLVEVLSDNVDITPERASRLVRITYTDSDPVMSARIVNGWAEAFIQTNLERRFEATSYAREFLEQRLAEVRDRLNESERRLVDYAAQERIINLEEETGQNNGRVRRSITAVDLGNLNDALGEARSDRIAAEAAYQRARSTSGSATGDSLSNVGISTLRQKRAEVEAEVARLRSLFGPEYPALVSLEAQLEGLSQAIGREEGRVLRTLRTNFETTVAREASLEREVDSLKGDMIDLQRRSIQFNIYQRDVDTNRELYDGLLQRYKEIGIAAGVGTNNVAIVDAAVVPEEPSGPRLLLNLLLGLLAGTGLGVALAFALDQLDETISDPSDVESVTDLPLLGTVPSTEDDDAVEAVSDPKSELTEAYLSIATSLRFATDHGIPTAFAITSSRPSEGKSTASLGLALTLARQGRRVVLLDCDMRNPSVHKLFGAKNVVGTSNLLAGEDVLARALNETMHPGLSAIYAGPQPPNAAELLSGEGLTRVLEMLQGSFDNVVVDSPPVLGLADAPLIAGRVDNILFVTEAHETPVRVVRNALDRIENSGANVLGLVLNKLDRNKIQYGYEYSYAYGSAATHAEEG